MPARLDTRPVASGYRGGIRTRLNNAAFPSRNRVLPSVNPVFGSTAPRPQFRPEPLDAKRHGWWGGASGIEKIGRLRRAS